MYERNRDVLTRLVAEFPRIPEYRDHLRIALFRLSQRDLAAGRLEEAERGSRRVLALGEEILRDNPDIALLPPQMTRLARFGSEHRDLAVILEVQGRIPEAISFYSKGISILEDAIRRQPLDVNAPQWLADLRQAQARAQTKLGASARKPRVGHCKGLETLRTKMPCNLSRRIAGLEVGKLVSHQGEAP